LGVLSGRADRRATSPVTGRSIRQLGVDNPSVGGRSAGDLVVADPPADDRLEASLATAVWAACAGIDLLRVHDVAATMAALAAAGVPPRSSAASGVSTTGGAPASQPIPKER
ncbi:MAG: hypothetical protein WAS75_11460, partial [Candidatus Microthrix subdominans]